MNENNIVLQHLIYNITTFFNEKHLDKKLIVLLYFFFFFFTNSWDLANVGMLKASEVVTRPSVLFIKRLRLMSFPANFAKFLETPFSIKHLRWLHLKV